MDRGVARHDLQFIAKAIQPAKPNGSKAFRPSLPFLFFASPTIAQAKTLHESISTGSASRRAAYSGRMIVKRIKAVALPFAQFLGRHRSARTAPAESKQPASSGAIQAILRAAKRPARTPRSPNSVAFSHTVQALTKPDGNEAMAAARQRDIDGERARCKAIYEASATVGCPWVGVVLMKSDLSIDAARAITAAIAKDHAAATPSSDFHGDNRIDRLKAMGAIQ